ncbi:hypothetical protein D9613_005090 [Agrocybe pediades]|uniref:Uncharacterized protein n=1 Tax=Agrocybe pediades TaxID=84607 RepID=A0A8H4QZQ2_9AGAR|nr:hypothetical protein D9613_005090 [Agrocybe pediades]KAF9568913.1 hypothetical protein CPC08DRAFT_702028 [Agrocybe pediades]
MSDDSNKRLLTEESRQSSSNADNFLRSSPFATSEDIVQQLRNNAARVRKSVQEGYRTTPSAFSRAQTMGSIFTPMNATLQDVYQNTNARAQQLDTSDSTRKRSRSVTRDDSPLFAESSAMDGVEDQSATGPATRPVKPLKPSRRMLETRSLPANAFSFGTPSQPSFVVPATTTEEDDWSELDPSGQTNSFEPIVFDAEF